MKKYDERLVSLISPFSFDYYCADWINREVVEDGRDTTVYDLDDKQARQALCIALKYIEKQEKRLDRAKQIVESL